MDERVPQQEAELIVKRVIEQLANQRRMLGLSQRALAAKAGVDPKTVSLIERGSRSPTLFTMSLLATAMARPLSQLLREAETSTETQP